MTDTTKLPEALRIAGILRVTGPRHMTSKWIGEAFLELERQHDRIAELEAQLEAVGAGGVGALTAKPVAASARWYMLNKIGMDTLCVDQSNAEQIAKDSDLMWPSMGPHCAVQLVGIGQVAQPTPTPAVVGPLERDRLLAALERAHAAESALRALVDECGNDMVIGWEGRMNERIAHSNKLLAAPKPHQVAELAGDLTDAQLVAVRAENELEAISIPAFRCAARAGIEADRKLRQEPPDDSLTIAYMSGRADGKSSAQAALAAKDATHEKQLNAHKSLIQSLENQRTTLREGAEKWVEAVRSLLSEREANAILTSEIAKLCTERDMWAFEHERQIDAKRGLAEELTALTAERDALRKDAMRYRWLRSAVDVTDGEFFVGVDSIDHCGRWALSGEESDETIDAAMTKEPK